MSQPQHLWCGFYPPVAPGAWMVSSAPYPVPTYRPSTSKRAPRRSDNVGDESNKEQIKPRRDHAAQRTAVPMRQKPSYPYARFWTSFRGLFPAGKREGEGRPDVPPVPFTAHNQRKTDGYSTQSVANRTQVRPPVFRSASSVTIDRKDPPKSVRRTDDDARRRVGNQSGGVPATLPPRSYDWSWPQFPTAQFVRLHPYLQHRCNGPPPIAFDIAHGLPTHPSTRASAIIPALDPTQLTQLATHPPVQRMHIRTVAEDPLPHVPWPIEVENARGITCGDVLDAIIRTFFDCVGEAEFRTWSRHRQGVSARAYHKRVQPGDAVKPSRARQDAGLRRIDYMGDRVVFHGLEQASAFVEDTWFMYVAVSERSKL